MSTQSAITAFSNIHRSWANISVLGISYHGNALALEQTYEPLGPENAAYTRLAKIWTEICNEMNSYNHAVYEFSQTLDLTEVIELKEIPSFIGMRIRTVSNIPVFLAASPFYEMVGGSVFIKIGGLPSGTELIFGDSVFFVETSLDRAFDISTFTAEPE